jgi:hypothetical protein
MRTNIRVFLDFEFTGLRQDTTPISIGMTTEDGLSFYAEFTDYDKSQVDAWIRNHVLVNLLTDAQFDDLPEDTLFIKGNRSEVREAVLLWLAQISDCGKEGVEFWGDVLAYDWVLFRSLLGGTSNMPANLYYIPFDIATLFKVYNVDPDINREAYSGLTMSPSKHNALWDAKVIMACYRRLMYSED